MSYYDMNFRFMCVRLGQRRIHKLLIIIIVIDMYLINCYIFLLYLVQHSPHTNCFHWFHVFRSAPVKIIDMNIHNIICISTINII